MRPDFIARLHAVNGTRGLNFRTELDSRDLRGVSADTASDDASLLNLINAPKFNFHFSMLLPSVESAVVKILEKVSHEIVTTCHPPLIHLNNTGNLVIRKYIIQEYMIYDIRIAESSTSQRSEISYCPLASAFLLSFFCLDPRMTFTRRPRGSLFINENVRHQSRISIKLCVQGM